MSKPPQRTKSRARLLAADWADESRARCAADYPRACQDFALVLQQQADPAMQAEARALHEALCSLDRSSGSCAVHARDLDFDGDRDSAIALLQTSCDANASDTCVVLREWTEPREPESPFDFAAEQQASFAEQTMRRDCDLGYGDACRAWETLAAR